MPSNPHKDEFAARRLINSLMNRTLRDNGQLLLSDVCREVLLLHQVAESMPERFIKKFYIDTGRVDFREGFLVYKPGEESERR